MAITSAKIVSNYTQRRKEHSLFETKLKECFSSQILRTRGPLSGAAPPRDSHITDLKNKKPFAPVLGRSDGDLAVRCWLHKPGWPGCQAGSLFRAEAILVLHEETSWYTKRLEAVSMRIVLSALLLLVWFPGLARRAWLHGKFPAQLAGISV